MATTDLVPVQNARNAFAQARRTLVDRLYEFEVATNELEQAKRSIAPGVDLEVFETAVAEAQNALSEARQQEVVTFLGLQAALNTWLPPGTPTEEDLIRLDADSPIVLFPVRIETRFDASVLKVRVFPDEIFLNTHETALTVEEHDAARHYYDELNQNDNERELWRDMVARFGVQRSAYILRQMLPVFGDPGPTSSYWASSSTCGGMLFGGGKEELFFPTDVQFRASTWTRPGEGVLPDRWVFVTYRGTERKIHLGNRIIEPMPMTPDPKLLDDSGLSTLISTTRGDYKIDNSIRWTVDFARAVELGMAIELALGAGEAATGFDRLIVVGVKSSMSALETSRMLEKLFDAHHYTRGLAIVRQGSPTNNTEGRPTPFPARENAGELSFDIERRRAPLDREFAHHCLINDTDGYALAFMLGVPSGVMANIDRAYEKEIDRAHVMNDVLWPGTLGYFMRHTMAPVFNATHIANARKYFRKYVLARGPAPAFRVGGTPYGVLPIASLREWTPRTFGASDGRMQELETDILDALQRLLAIWLEGVPKVPRVKPNAANPDVNLAEVLSTTPSSREFRIRSGQGLVTLSNLFFLFGWDIFELIFKIEVQSRTTFGRLGFPDWRPLLGRTLWSKRGSLVTIPIVTQPLSETLTLPGLNFIANIAAASARALNEQTHPGAEPDNLLYKLLRHSTLAEYSRIASENTTTTWVEYEIFGIPLTTTTQIIPSVYQLDEQQMTLKSLALSHISGLNQLACVPTAELERLFTETLDLTAHRLDAWITAFAYRRIEDMRLIQERNQLATKGDFLGGYGWLEEVRPRPHPATSLPDGRAAETQVGNGGFVHTPSMSHAAAAAVLRNGNLSFRGENAAAYAVDLSSRRVREGRRLFEGVRNGQPVGALLGYQFERALHDAGISELDQLRFDLRSRFPLVANKNGHDSDEPAEAIAARNVVDGERLRDAYVNGQLNFETDPILPRPGTDEYDVTIAELDKLDRAYDAAADLLTAEGVFQLVRGNIEAGFPTLENIVEGQKPPDSIISRSARGGIGIAHRVIFVFPSDHTLALPGTWPAPTHRAVAEPVLNAWLGQLIGDPAAVSARLTYLDENGDVITSTHEEAGQPVVKQNVSVTLSDLALHPLDVLALAEAIAQSNQGSILDLRIITAALNDPDRAPDATPARFQIEYGVLSGRSFVEIIEVLGTAGAVLRASRALEIADLLPPAEVDEGTQEDEAAPIGGTNAKAFYQRGQTAATALRGAIAQLVAAGTDTAALKEALREAALFLPLSAFPDPTAADESVAEAADAALKELRRREDSLPIEIEPPAQLDSTPSTALLTHGRDTLRGVFGTSFVAMPDVDPPRPDELDLSLQARATLLPGAGDDVAPDRYLQQITRSRTRLGRFRKLSLYARASGLARPRVHLVQLPHVPGEKWLGLPFDGAPPPDEGRAALLLLSYAETLDPTAQFRGFVIDNWVEVIPNRMENTGFAFHYVSPAAQAPQAVLVAAPSRNNPKWSFEELLASFEQTMDLMKIRAVGQEYLDLGQMLPATILGSNPNIENTVSSTFAEQIGDAIGEALSGG